MNGQSDKERLIGSWRHIGSTVDGKPRLGQGANPKGIIIYDAHGHMACQVAPVVRFTDEADAIRWANATEFGLVSYVYTRDLRRGLRVSEALDAGMIGLNRGLVSDPAAPFGGVKQSGLGREGAHEGLLEYTETKYIATDW